MTRARLLVLAVSLFGALAAPPAHALYGPVGTLNQPHGPAEGCLDDAATPPCADVRAMSGVGGVALSPDGATLLVTAPSTDGVAVLKRDPATGLLTQPDSVAGCVAPPGNALSCRPAKNLDGAVDAVFSPDGRHVYVAGSNGISAFQFNPDPAIGGLIPLAGSSCFSNDGTAQPGSEASACVNGRALAALTAIAITPDGAFLLAAVDAGGDPTDGVVILRRDLTTGQLSQDDAPGGCASKTTAAGGDGDVPTPGSAPKGCAGELRAIDDPTDIALSRDGGTVYVASREGVAVLTRSAHTLTQTSAASGCAVSLPQSNCADARALGEPNSLALSPDGADLYVSNASVPEVAHFRVDASGALAQPADETGCAADAPTPTDGPPPCAVARSLLSNAPGIGVSPDGATVAVGGTEAIGEVALLDRSSSGGLSQAADTRGCVSHTGGALGSGGGAGKCLAAAGTGGRSFAWSAGSHHFYAAGGSSVAFLRREVAPACANATAVTDSLTPVTVAFSCTDLNGEAVSLEVAGAPSKGSVGAPTASGSLLYTPRTDVSGLDSFLVRPRDQSANAGALATATVNVLFKSGGPASPPAAKAPLPRLLTKVLRPDAKSRVRFSLECPSTASVNCKGRAEIATAKRLRLRDGSRARRVRVHAVSYDIRPGSRKRLVFRTSRDVRVLLRRYRRFGVTVLLKAPAQGRLAAAQSRATATLKR